MSKNVFIKKSEDVKTDEYEKEETKSGCIDSEAMRNMLVRNKNIIQKIRPHLSEYLLNPNNTLVL